MHAPRALARFNRYVTNPIQRRWAGRIPAHAIVEHTGRTSGRAYRTPVMAFRSPTGFAFLVGYGLQSDWVRNILAADGGSAEHRGKHYTLTEAHVVPKPEGRSLLPAPMRLLTRLTGSGDVLAVRAQPS
ncbi:MAG TPA: nitroreductase family deazaflavin-dependent oxidoreductase [Jatrophihabitans sp.]|jgi:deazaflavin-dependent oxidoreductase (nitroreductase family)